MKSILKIKGKEVLLCPLTSQVSNLGREFKLSGVRIDYSKNQKWIDGKPFHCTYYIFKYLDDGTFFGFYFDEHDIFLHKLTHKEVKELH